MSATTLFIIGIVAAGLLAIAGVLTIAAFRGGEADPITGEFDRRARRRDRIAAKEREAAGAGVALLAPPEAAEAEVEEQPPPPDPLSLREELTPNEMGVTRRKFFNRSLLAIFGIFLGQFAIASLAFLWPKLKGGFGTPIKVGPVDALRAEILQGDGSIVPKFVAEAQSWIVPFDDADLEGSSFESTPEVVAGGGGGAPGLMALWQRCVHLGCRVPECLSSQGFECPCHGSRYNFHGEYESGPAPRNMDRFAVEVDAAGNLVVLTGEVRETARAKTKTIPYPQGPSCV